MFKRIWPALKELWRVITFKSLCCYAPIYDEIGGTSYCSKCKTTVNEMGEPVGL